MVEILSVVPLEKAIEITDFADFIMKKYEEENLQKDIQQLASTSTSFDFLNHEEYLYSEEDLKEKY